MALADWDARLLSPERALALAGDWPVYADVQVAKLSEFGDEPDQWQINLRCNEDHQSIARVGYGRKYEDLHALGGCKTTIGDLLSDVIRHMVTAHNLSLSGAGRVEPAPDDGIGPLIVSPSEDHARFIDVITKEQTHG